MAGGKNSKYSMPMVALVICIILFSDCFIVCLAGQRVFYDFVRYPFRKKPKLERQFKISMRTCEQGDECSREEGLNLLRCSRICVAPSCYWELYGHDELELGEIDVRVSSFKGCWAEKYKR